jgi:hypothetical protein
MSSFSWKSGFAGLAILAATAYAVAQMPSGQPGMLHGDGMPSGMHERMMQMMRGHGMQGLGMPGGMGGHAIAEQHSGSAVMPVLPGQDAFGAIGEVVRILKADPSTDWSKVNIAALREHLIDMNELTLHAAAAERKIDDGLEIVVTGEGRTLDAIKRMVPAHAAELVKIGWKARTEDLPNGVKLVVTTTNPNDLIKLTALGFMGIMVEGGHHQMHHLMIAKGEVAAH